MHLANLQDLTWRLELVVETWYSSNEIERHNLSQNLIGSCEFQANFLFFDGIPLGVVSSSFLIAQILVQSHFELDRLVLALEATEPVTQMAVELINNHLISLQQKQYTVLQKYTQFCLFMM